MSNEKRNSFRKVTSVDVARHAGVSRSAVSRTFTPSASVSAETREKVLKSAEALGYRVNKLASSLTNKRSDLVGIVASNMDNPFRARQVEALSRQLMAKNLRPILLLVEGDEDPSQVIGMLLEYNVSGVIVTSDTPPQSICEECVALGVPMVLVNKAETNAAVDRVLLDNQKSGVLAAQTLYDAGCRHLAVVTIEKPSYSLQVRIEAFVEHSRQLELDPVILYRGPLQNYQGGQRAADFLMADRIAESRQVAAHIDGVFCVSDYMALGFLDQLRLAQKIDVPKQLKVISCDDIPQAEWPIYNLTTIQQDTKKLAAVVIDVLLNRIEQPDAAVAVEVLDVELVARSTTAQQ